MSSLIVFEFSISSYNFLIASSSVLLSSVLKYFILKSDNIISASDSVDSNLFRTISAESRRFFSFLGFIRSSIGVEMCSLDKFSTILSYVSVTAIQSLWISGIVSESVGFSLLVSWFARNDSTFLKESLLSNDSISEYTLRVFNASIAPCVEYVWYSFPPTFPLSQYSDPSLSHCFFGLYDTTFCIAPSLPRYIFSANLSGEYSLSMVPPGMLFTSNELLYATYTSI